MESIGSKPESVDLDEHPVVNVIYRETTLEDVRDMFTDSLKMGQPWKDWNQVRKNVSQLNFFGVTALVEGSICGMVLWRPDKKTARIFYTWAFEDSERLMANMLTLVASHIPAQLKTVSAVINEDSLDLCNHFKAAKFKSIRVLPKIFEGRDGILFMKPREESNVGDVPDEG